jgi:hypothetical protein
VSVSLYAILLTAWAVAVPAVVGAELVATPLTGQLGVGLDCRPDIAPPEFGYYDPCDIPPNSSIQQRAAPVFPLENAFVPGNVIDFRFNEQNHQVNPDLDIFCFEILAPGVQLRCRIFRTHHPDGYAVIRVAGFSNSGQRYSWRVKEAKAAAFSQSFVNGTAPEPQAPGAPTGLGIVEDFGDSVQFGWAPRPANENVNRYTFSLVPLNGRGPGPSCGTSTSTTGLSCGGFADDGRRYRFLVRACNDAKGCGPPAEFSFTNGPTMPPDPPEPIDPFPGANDRSVEGTEVVFDWEDGPRPRGTDSYNLRVVCTHDGVPNVVICDEETTEQFFYCGGFRNRGDACEWKVRARNATGWSDFSVTRSFTNRSNAKPEAPRLLSPSNDAKVGGASIGFTWQSTEFAATYHLRVRNLTTGATVCRLDGLTVPNASACPFTQADGSLTFPEDGTWFEWWVYAENANGDEGPESAHFYFENVPPAPTQAPTGLNVSDRGDHVVLGWTGVPRATRYYFEVRFDANGSWLCGGEVSGTQATCHGFKDVGDAFDWWVFGVNDGGTGPGGSASFVNGPSGPPDAPILVGPGPFALEQVTFSWLPARRAVTYTLSLNYVGTFPPGPFPCGMGASRQRTGITSTTFRCGGFRNDGQRYIWSVSACNSRGCTTSPSLGFINGNPTGPDGGPNNDDAGNVPQPSTRPPRTTGTSSS